MATQFNGVAVGAMQYNGATIGEAMMDGQIVYRSTIYPVVGAWQGPLLFNHSTFDEHTIAESGTYTITQTVSGGGAGVFANLVGPWGTTLGSSGTPSVVTVTEVLAVGDLVKFQAAAVTPSGVASGTWSITKL